jgi:hypothetical protein
MAKPMRKEVLCSAMLNPKEASTVRKYFSQVPIVSFTRERSDYPAIAGDACHGNHHSRRDEPTISHDFTFVFFADDAFQLRSFHFFQPT